MPNFVTNDQDKRDRDIAGMAEDERRQWQDRIGGYVPHSAVPIKPLHDIWQDQFNPAAFKLWLTLPHSPAAPPELVAVNSRVRGWSGLTHWRFFEGLLIHGARNFLICGVCHGRDICYLIELHKLICPTEHIYIVGCDLFDDAPCADWPEAKRGMSWEDAGFGPAPSLDNAILNTEARLETCHIELKRETSATALDRAWPIKFDVVYLDTSHDYATVYSEIVLAKQMMRPPALLCGDDYRGEAHWGVEKACRELLKPHSVYQGMCWFHALTI